MSGLQPRALVNDITPVAPDGVPHPLATLEDAPNHLPEISEAEGLLDEAREPLAREARSGVLLVVAAREEDAHVGSDPTELAKGLLAAHVGHGHVEEDEGEVFAPVAEQLEGGAAILCRHDGEAEALEHSLAHGPGGEVVVDEEHRAAPLPLLLGLSVVAANTGAAVGRGEQDQV